MNRALSVKTPAALPPLRCLCFLLTFPSCSAFLGAEKVGCLCTGCRGVVWISSVVTEVLLYRVKAQVNGLGSSPAFLSSLNPDPFQYDLSVFHLDSGPAMLLSLLNGIREDIM